MFFKIHPEKRIGYKLLSSADLGLSITSNQTHIGLFDDIFTFLHNREVEEQAMFIYNNTSTLIDCFFDRIENTDGSFRSPKIRKGEKNSVSVVTIIRDIAKSFPSSTKWFLIWFGLENEDMVFYLFNDESEDYNIISKIIDLNKSGRISDNNLIIESITKHLENIVNKSNSNILQELEIAAQLGNTKKYKPFDLEKANKLFKDIGNKGELLIAEYLDILKLQGRIFNFTWYNKSMETGLPYDFTIQENNQNINFIDVKSTSFSFEQPLIFSNQEIEFITLNNNYSIYRVYNLADDLIPSLRINSENSLFANSIYPYFNTFKENMDHINVGVHSVKLSVSPITDNFNFKSAITLK